MKDFCTEDIRNVVILGGSGVGKTTLVEALSFATEKTNKLGSILDGNTISDYEKEEVKRHFSINTTIIPMEWKGCKVNILDTPGGADFVGERIEAASAADCAVIVVNGKKDVDVGAKNAWKLCEKFNLPRIFFVTGMDDDDASYRKIVEQLSHLYGKSIAPFHMPIRREQKLIGYADITKMQGRRFIGVAKYEEMEIPDYCTEYLSKFKNSLDEAVASTDETLMEKYFSEQEFSQEEIDKALRSSCIDGSIVPVSMGSGLHVHGVFMLLDAIVKFMPYPMTVKSGIEVYSNKMFDCVYDVNETLVAQCFKTISDPFIGRYSIVKVYSGKIKPDSEAYNPAHDTIQKIGKIYGISGKEFIPVENIVAGDIGAIPKLNDTLTGDTISTKKRAIKLPEIEFAKPYTTKRYMPKEKKDEDKIYTSLLKMLDEDRTLELKNDGENGQQLISGIGEQQLDIMVAKLSQRYKIDVELLPPKIAYKETICKQVSVQGRYKKQSGGHGQFGDVKITFEPSGNRKIAYIFEESVVGGAVPKNYFSAVEKGIEESVKEGLLAGYPVVGLKAILTDGSYHPVDSSDNAFKMAAEMAYKEAYLQAEPILLEPIANVKIYAPTQYTGDIISDLKTRRSRVLGMIPLENGDTYIDADMPMSEIDGYQPKLRSITEGYATYEYEFTRYGQTPENITKEQVELYQKR